MNDIEEKNISKDDEQNVVYCTFCTKSSLEVKVLISAPHGSAYICGDCVVGCGKLVENFRLSQED